MGGRTDPVPGVCNWGMHDGRANFAGVQPTWVFLDGGIRTLYPVGVFSAHKSQAERPLGAIASRCEYITLVPGVQTWEPRANGGPPPPGLLVCSCPTRLMLKPPCPDDTMRGQGRREGLPSSLESAAVLNSCPRQKPTTRSATGAGASLPPGSGNPTGELRRSARPPDAGTGLPEVAGPARQPSATGSARTGGWADHTRRTR